LTIPIEAIREAVACGWCTSANESKQLDAELAEAIAIEVYTLAENHINGEAEEELR